MRVGIHQLHYLPWLRYFDKIARADVFVVLDNVQYNKNGWQNRNKIKTADGITLLTVPVHAHAGQTLDAIRIDDTMPWRKKHWRSIEQSYRAAPFFEAHLDFLHATYARSWERLNDLNRHMLGYFVGTLGIQTPILYASDLRVPGIATERLINLVRAVGGDTYITGAFAAGEYLDVSLFEQASIALEVQEWHAPTYPQLHGAFAPDLSIVDLLLNCGPDSLGVLLGQANAGSRLPHALNSAHDSADNGRGGV